MKKLFDDIMAIDGVVGAMLVSFEGEIIYKDFKSPQYEKPESKEWWNSFVDSLNKIREADLVFEKIRLYVRTSTQGLMMVFIKTFAPIAMIRLNCDLLLPLLKEDASSKGRGGLFKKKKKT